MKGKKNFSLRILLVFLLISVVGLLPGCATVSGWFGDSEAETAEIQAKKHWDKAMGHRMENDNESCAAQLELAIKADPTMYQAYYQLGLVYKDLNQPELARQAWKYGLQEARTAPERPDYPKEQAIAQMQAALAGLDRKHTETIIKPSAEPQKTKAKAEKSSLNSSQGKKAYAVLFSSNLKKQNAQADIKRLKANGYKAMIKVHKDKKGRIWNRVWVGCCHTRAKALALRASMMKKGLGKDLQVMVP